MKVLGIGAAMAAAACITGCNAQTEGAGAEDGPVTHGRYVGIGLYPAQALWSKMAAASQPQDKAAATIEDDEQIIVVVDSKTGEIRQCGNLTGYCVGMNPWTRALLASQATPVKLTKHAAELAPEISNQVDDAPEEKSQAVDSTPTGNAPKAVSK